MPANHEASRGQLAAMINQIDANVPNKLSAGEAQDLIADINALREKIGC